MKIVLLEDRIGRMEQFSETDLTKESCINIISGEDLKSMFDEINSNNIDRIKDYECIILHRSAFTNSQRDIIKNYCSDAVKPLVYFSGGISSSIYNDRTFPFLHINSKDLYSQNLRLFIDEIEKHNQINLHILEFGNRWKVNLLLTLRNHLNFGVQLGNIKRIRDLKISHFIKEELIENFNLTWLKEDSYSSISSEQVAEFRTKIDTLIFESV